MKFRKYMRLDLEGMMDEIRWALHRINWSLYRDDSGLWMAFSSNAENHKTMDKTNMESWLAHHGLRTEEVEKLVRDAETKGEAAITVSHLHEPPD